MFPGATKNVVAGHIWPAGRYLPTPDLELSTLLENSFIMVPFVSPTSKLLRIMAICQWHIALCSSRAVFVL